MAPGVPGDGGDAVTELDAVAIQPLRDFQRAIANFGVIRAMNGTFDGSRDDLLCAVISRRVFDNLGAVLKAGGRSFADVVRTTVFLADMNDFATVNEVYGTYFSEPYPARATVQVARLPKDARVEIDVIATYE